MRTIFKRLLCFRVFRLRVRSFKSQSTFLNHYDSKLGFDDTQLLYYLSNDRLEDARHLLEKMPDKGSRNRVVRWTSLLTMYSRNGFIDEASKLFDIMPERNIVTYNALLSGYVRCGRLNEACRLFEEMPDRNVVSWTCMLCGLTGAGRIHEAWKLFDEMPERNNVSWNSMITGLIRNGYLVEAREVFDKMPGKNVVSWNAMTAGYAENGRMEEARVLFEGMEDRNVITWTSMIAGYCRAGDVQQGYCLFLRMPERNVVSWTAMIGGFAWNGFHQHALQLLIEMRPNYHIRPNIETFISLAYACAGLVFPKLAKQLHVQVIINAIEDDDYDRRLLKGIIHMYSVCGAVNYATAIFFKKTNVVSVESCNSLISGYIRSGRLEDARSLFDKLLVQDKVSATSLIDAYMSTGQVTEAYYMFNNMSDKDAIAWTAMISGCVHNELFAEAFDLLLTMRMQGISPFNSTYAILFGAAGAMANLDRGRLFHGMLVKTLSETDLILENSLISMYAKCGEINESHRIFRHMSFKDLVSWNSMIMGFSHHGLVEQTLNAFEEMLESGIRPNSVTFLALLSSCNHAGLVQRGWQLFNEMTDVYSVQPGFEHHICMINLLGRAGKVKEAEEFVLSLQLEPNCAIWGALLGVCGFGQTDLEIARRAAKKLLELDPLNGAAHVVLCNVYSANGEHGEEHKLRKEMGVKGVKKIPGCSWILLKGMANVFLSGNKLNPEVNEMLFILFATIV